jgi:aminodeoxyfutalosine synthase
MLYGHVETVEERVDHLIRLREAQDETGGFQAFIPLSFHPANTRLSHLPGPTGVEDLTVIAASRLLLDNFAHIKAYWIMLGLKLAQTALYFGADDLDGTVVEEVITRMAGGVTDGEVPVDELVQEVKAAGLVPVERDTFYETVRVYE